MARYEQPQTTQYTASATPSGPDITQTAAYKEMLSKGNITEGQRKAYMELAKMQTRSASDYIGATDQDNIYADPQLQAMLTSSEGSYNPADIQRIIAQRTAALSDKQALGQQTYNSYVDDAGKTVQWWNEHPDGYGTDLMDYLVPLAIGAVAVVALAGAGTAAMGAAQSAGTSAAGAASTGEIGSAVTSSIGAVAGDSTVAGALASSAAVDPALSTVIIHGTAGAAAGGMTIGQIAAVGATAAGVGAVASGGAGTPSNIPTVAVSAPHLPPADAGVGDLGASAAAAAGIGAVAAGGTPSTVEVHGTRPPAPTPQEIGPIPVAPLPSSLPPGWSDPPPVNGAPSGTTPHPILPGGSGGSGIPGLGGLIPGLAVGGLIGGLTDGLDEPTSSGGVTGSIGKLNHQGDQQMAEWENFLYPEAKSALAKNSDTVDDFVRHTNTNAGAQEAMGGQEQGAATDWLKRYKDVYVPQADRIIADANQFDKGGYQEQQAGLAIGDLSAAMAADKAARAQQNAQYGIDPTSGRSMAFDRAAGVTGAANIASAANKARMAAEDIWGQKQINALKTADTLGGAMNTYNGLTQGAGSLFTNANSLRQQGVKATSDYFTNVNDLAKTADQTYSTANGAYTSAGQLGLGQSKLDYDKYIAEMQGRGQVIGAGLSALSGKNGIVGDLSDAAKSAGGALGSIGSWIGQNVFGSGGQGIAAGEPTGVASGVIDNVLF